MRYVTFFLVINYFTSIRKHHLHYINDNNTYNIDYYLRHSDVLNNIIVVVLTYFRDIVRYNDVIRTEYWQNKFISYIPMRQHVALAVPVVFIT